MKKKSNIVIFNESEYKDAPKELAFPTVHSRLNNSPKGIVLDCSSYFISCGIDGFFENVKGVITADEYSIEDIADNILYELNKTHHCPDLQSFNRKLKEYKDSEGTGEINTEISTLVAGDVCLFAANEIRKNRVAYGYEKIHDLLEYIIEAIIEENTFDEIPDEDLVYTLEVIMSSLEDPHERLNSSIDLFKVSQALITLSDENFGEELIAGLSNEELHKLMELSSNNEHAISVIKKQVLNLSIDNPAPVNRSPKRF